MKRIAIVALGVVAIALAMPVTTHAATGSILIYGPTLLGSPDNEQTLAQAAGYDVTVADADTWRQMTTFEFSLYDAIVFGDPSCTYESETTPLATAEFHRTTWSAAVTGPKVVIGTDPMYHQSEFGRQAKQLTTNAINFAASGSTTGLYVSLSCYYGLRTGPVELLREFGVFDVYGQGTGGLVACPDDVEIVNGSHPVMAGITTAGLSNWGCSIHETFKSFPPTFDVIARDNPTDLPYVIADDGGPVTDAPTRYAPFVYLHPSESAFPNSGSNFIANSRLRWSHDNCRDHAVENPDGSDASFGAIDQSRLGEAAGSGAYSHTGNIAFVCVHGSRGYLANELTRPHEDNPDRVTSGVEGMFLDLRNSAHKGNPSLGADPVYYDYVEHHYVVYWFFYNYNPHSVKGVGKHEGDWEHIVVHLDQNDAATEVAYYRHTCDPTIVSWNDLQAGDGTSSGLMLGTHPIAYSGDGSHASYPEAGSYGASTCQSSDSAEAGPRWTTWTNLQDVHAQPWYGFGGAWGEVSDLSFNTGPLGPSKWKGGAPSGW